MLDGDDEAPRMMNALTTARDLELRRRSPVVDGEYEYAAYVAHASSCPTRARLLARADLGGAMLDKTFQSLVASSSTSTCRRARPADRRGLALTLDERVGEV